MLYPKRSLPTVRRVCDPHQMTLENDLPVIHGQHTGLLNSSLKKKGKPHHTLLIRLAFTATFSSQFQYASEHGSMLTTCTAAHILPFIL